MSIVITGASGQLGRLTAERLLELVDPAEIVLVTRSPGQLTGLAARGADVRRGDFDDPGSLAEAFAGAERLLLISTDAIGSRLPQHRNAIEAASNAGVSLLAYTSIPNPTEENPALAGVEHRQTEALLRESGLDHVVLRNSIYAQMRVPAAKAALASGRLVHNHGEGRIAHVDRADCAAVAAAVLAGGEHAGRICDVTGPELMSAAEIAAVISDVGGKQVTAVAVDDREMEADMLAHGFPAVVAERLTTSGMGLRGGFLDVQTDVVAELTGRPPRSLRDVLEEHRDELS